MTDNIIDLNQKRVQKNRMAIVPEKRYIISGEMAILLLRFARFIAGKDGLKTDEDKMQAIGWMATLTCSILKENFEEVK